MQSRRFEMALEWAEGGTPVSGDCGERERKGEGERERERTMGTIQTTVLCAHQANTQRFGL